MLVEEGLEGAALREEGEGVPDLGRRRVEGFWEAPFVLFWGRFCLSVGGGLIVLCCCCCGGACGGKVGPLVIYTAL